MEKNPTDYKKIAQKLKRKYSRISKINEAKIESRKKVVLCIAIVFSVFLFLLVSFCAIFCVGAFLNSINKTPDMLLGVSSVRLTTESMQNDEITINGLKYKSGLNQDDDVTIHSVAPSTLAVGDIIAFYAYSPSLDESKNIEMRAYPLEQNSSPKLAVNFAQTLGFYSNEIYTAAQDGGVLTISHVAACFVDSEGKLWFQTQSSTSKSPDSYLINQDLILGVVITDAEFGGILSMISFFYSVGGLLILLLLPVGVIFGLFFKSEVNKHRINNLELDVVEQKRKITDKICVQNDLGLKMSEPVKLKVLAQAKFSDLERYGALLWKDGKNPSRLATHLHKNKLKLYPMRKLCVLNNECESRFFSGEDINQIAKHYATEKQIILAQKRNIFKKLKLAKQLIREKQK